MPAWPLFVGALVLAIVALAPGCASWVNEDEIVLSMDELPAAIKLLAEKEIATGKVKEVEKETKGGKGIYAITYYDENNVLMEIEYAENGKLISKAKE
jgi:hypothetical protein